MHVWSTEDYNTWRPMNIEENKAEKWRKRGRDQILRNGEKEGETKY